MEPNGKIIYLFIYSFLIYLLYNISICHIVYTSDSQKLRFGTVDYISKWQFLRQGKFAFESLTYSWDWIYSISN